MPLIIITVICFSIQQLDEENLESLEGSVDKCFENMRGKSKQTPHPGRGRPQGISNSEGVSGIRPITGDVAHRSKPNAEGEHETTHRGDDTAVRRK